MAAAASSGFVENWQAGKTVTECNLRMLQEEDSCDVTFQCGAGGHVVKAHRYMLISRSCVFHAMLTGPMAEKSAVKIPDVELIIFKTFLKYLYTDDTDIDANNVTALLYTARKYGVTSLETKCTELLDKGLNSDNACVILEAAHHFDQKELYEKALTLIKSQGERSLHSPGFLELSHVLVDEIVGSDDLGVDEHVIFTAVNDWSESECARKGKEVTPEVKRSILGNILMKVRFPLMETAFIADNVKESRLLTDAERISCLDYIALPKKNSTPFNHKRRIAGGFSKCVSKSRFLHYVGSWGVDAWYIDAISFGCSANLLLLGCQLYGACQVTGKYNCNVTSYFGGEDNVLSCVVQERTQYTCDGEVFDVVFSRPVFVSAGDWYTLVVKIEGPQTYRGKDGKDRVVCDDGVELQFRNSRYSNDGTNTREGQIPSLIYRKR